eukprot:GILJ01001720.1.p1 GENE.GILJ01001720.1~~GILJ01001720.1.p1  ORF type:complete len:799 (-),score=83.98 GILJ01001720.1:434-2830(-)
MACYIPPFVQKGCPFARATFHSTSSMEGQRYQSPSPIPVVENVMQRTWSCVVTCCDFVWNWLTDPFGKPLVAAHEITRRRLLSFQLFLGLLFHTMLVISAFSSNVYPELHYLRLVIQPFLWAFFFLSRTFLYNFAVLGFIAVWVIEQFVTMSVLSRSDEVELVLATFIRILFPVFLATCILPRKVLTFSIPIIVFIALVFQHCYSFSLAHAEAGLLLAFIIILCVSLIIFAILNRQAHLEALMSKQRFTSNISHELRTPLNGIIGILELMMESSLSQYQKDLARTALISGENMLQLVNDLLDFHKLEAGKLPLVFETFSIRQFVEECVCSVATLATAKGLKLDWKVDPRIPELICGDRRRIKQILLNYLSNAFKFTMKGSVTVEVSTVEGDAKRAMPILKYSVKDTGIGIKEEDKKFLFKPFVQLDSTKPGTGLGLVICKQLASVMGGDTGFEPIATGGTRFWFTVATYPVMPKGSSARSAVADSSPHSGLGLVQTFKSFLNRLESRLFHKTAVDYSRSSRGNSSRNSKRYVPIQDKITSCLNSLTPRNGVRSPLDHMLKQMEPSPSGSSSAKMSPTRPYANTLQKVYAKTSSDEEEEEEYGSLIHGFRAKIIAHERNISDSKLHNSKGKDGKGEVHLPLTGPTVLVAEDNCFNQQVAGLILKSMNFEVTFADNGQHCVDIYTASPRSYVFILMDCQMPVMDGLQATKTIRAIERAKNLPEITIIGLTADAAADNIHRCHESGMDDVLTKPFRKKQLIQKLRLQREDRAEKARSNSPSSSSSSAMAAAARRRPIRTVP